MKPHHEKLLVATLAGMVILSAAAFAVSPAMAAGDASGAKSILTGVVSRA